MFKNQQGIAHILLILFLLVALVAGLYLLSRTTNFLPKAFFPNVGNLVQKQPTVEVKTEYQNPFDKKTQYVNPFDQYKSPSLNLKK